jgi:hypothetical protein
MVAAVHELCRHHGAGKIVPHVGGSRRQTVHSFIPRGRSYAPECRFSPGPFAVGWPMVKSTMMEDNAATDAVAAKKEED